MRKLLDRLHAKLGDFWFYSLMVLAASRAADALNVFVGIWLVPHFIDKSELGAVLPLTNFANALAVPVTAFAIVFMKEVNRLALNRSFGQMKSLLKGVFSATAISLLVAIIISRIVLPSFLKRIRIIEGSLGVLVIASAFISCASPVYTNALQALKKFGAISLLHIISAPLRLVAMLLTMPLRPLAGYYIGQSTPGLASILGSMIAARKELSAAAEPYWTRAVGSRLTKMFLGTLACLGPSSICIVIENMVLRQRLPDADSAAFYMVTRFSDIAAYLAIPLISTMFPFTSELAEQGRPTRGLVLRCVAAITGINTLLAVIFLLLGENMLVLLPGGALYAEYHWAIPWLIGITTLISIQSCHTSTEISAGRFSFLKWWIPINVLYPIALLFVTGHGYFTQWMPSGITKFLTAHNITSLEAMLTWMTVFAFLKAVISIVEMITHKQTKVTIRR